MILKIPTYIHGLIIDWGGTLWDPSQDALFPESVKFLKACRQCGIKIVLVSLARTESPSLRLGKIIESGVYALVDWVIVNDAPDKDLDLDRALKFLNLNPINVMVLGDRTRREIAWAVKRNIGHIVWICQGKWAHELPDRCSQPHAIINNIGDLLK